MCEKLQKTHEEIGNETLADLALEDALDAFEKAISFYISAESSESKRLIMNIITPLHRALNKFAKFGSQPNKRFEGLKKIVPTQNFN